jgi:hypothetical protein
MLRRLVFAPSFGTVHFALDGTTATVVHTIHTPVVADLPVLDSDSTPLPGGVIPRQEMAFGPHTVHRAALRTPADAVAPAPQVVS